MKLTQTQQLEFTTLLFDALFGLILFFGIDAFLEVKDFSHFIFYLSANIILIHWWLIFKSAYDIFGNEVINSATHIVFGIIEIILIDYLILFSTTFQYIAATQYLLALFAVDFIWAVIWRYVGHWQTKDTQRIKAMECELDNNLRANALMIVLFSLLLYFSSFLSSNVYLAAFIAIYLAHIVFTFKKHIIDIRIF